MKKGQKYTAGDVFGEITLVEMVKRKSPKSERERSGWIGKCSCGNLQWYEITNLTSGNTTKCKQCGNVTRSENRSTHGATKKGGDANKKRLHGVWGTMKARCHNENSSSYERYGGRGIKVCKEWRDSFEKFFQDMGCCEKGQTIDRIDNDGNYEPGNCQWSDRFAQGNNKRNNVRGDYLGRSISISEAAAIASVTYDFIKQRLHKGFSMQEAIDIPKNTRRKRFYAR